MLGMITQRFFNQSKIYLSGARMSSLAKLRKSTGYSMSNCKKALGLFPDDVAKAEEWLHEEAKQKGWEKWAKIQSRSATQGLVGTYSKDTIAAMLEVNCETDFVSRNSEFQAFVEKVLISCINHMNDYDLDEDILKIQLDETQLNSLKFESTTVGELIGAATCKFNEKTVTKRAVCYKVKNGISLSSISHPSMMFTNLSGATLGKYGALLAYKHRDIESRENINDLGLNICQHIIGLSPLSIGQFTEEDMKALHKKQDTPVLCDKSNVTIDNEQYSKSEDSDLHHKENDGDQIDTKIEDVDKNEDAGKNEDAEDEVETHSVSKLKDMNETRLLHQPFLLDPNVTVGEIVLESSIDVLQFDRFECGECDVIDSEIVAQSVQA